jgi:signal transduction histidine kinase/two-component SAPR family response regulator
MKDPIPETLRILLVEDESHDRNAFVRTLARSRGGHEVTESESAEDALRRLHGADRPFHVVVSDHGLPGMDGLELLRAMQEQGLDLPFLLLTGNGSGDLTVQALRQGAEDCMVKDQDQAYLQVLPDLLPAVVARHRHRMFYEQEQKILPRERVLFEAVFNYAPEGIVVCDEQARIVMANPAAERLYARPIPFGRPYESHAEMRLQQPDGTPYDPRSLPLSRAALDGETVRNEEVRIVWPDGSSRTLLVNAAPLRDADGASTGAVGMFQDVSYWKEAERERQDLLERVSVQAAELEKQKRAADAATMAKSDFLASMSHEIRTPMNALLGMTRLVLANDLDERQKERVEMIYESAGSLLDILNDVLDYSKIEAGKLDLEEKDFSLVPFVESLATQYKVLAQSKRLALELHLDEDVPRRVRGDRQRLRQILTNLLNNAVKFTDKGGVELRLEAVGDKDDARRDNAVLRFSVRDTGIGIPEDSLSSIFESFTQVDSGYTRKKTGTGLGLAISKRLAELLGGTLWVESMEGEGSTFYLLLTMPVAREDEAPLEPEAEAEAVPEPEEEEEPEAIPEQPTMNILLAEDNQINSIMAMELLEEAGHRVTAVENGEEALQALEAGDYDLVLMDVQMPVMDGVTATRMIRESESGKFDPEIPVIGLSAYAMKGDRERFLDTGMDYYVTKPLEAEYLFNILRAVWASRDAEVRESAGRKRQAPERAGTAEVKDPEQAARNREDKPYDREGLLNKYRNNTDLLKKILFLYIDETPARVERLAGEVEQGDFPAVADLAHRLTGASSTIRAHGLCDMLKEMERRSEAEDQNTLRDLVPQVQDELERILEGLTHLLQSLEDDTATA